MGRGGSGWPIILTHGRARMHAPSVPPTFVQNHKFFFSYHVVHLSTAVILASGSILVFRIEVTQRPKKARTPHFF